VTRVATGVPTATSFAFDPSGTVFVGAFGDERTAAGGGVYAIAPGATTATLVPGTPVGVAGVVFRDGTLYVSAVSRRGGSIRAFSGWDGTSFAASKTIFDAAKTVGSVNGLAFGPDGRLYGGAGLTNDVNKKGRVNPSPFPDPYTVFSITPSGGDFKVVSRGLRQPWQLAFVASSPNPYVTTLSQERKPIPGDAIVVARPGANFGFPTCFLGVGPGCGRKTFAKPLIALPKHSSPVGIGASGETLYVALFGGLQQGQPAIVSIPAAGGTPTPFLTGFVAPVVATNVDAGNLWAGDLSGSIYRVPLGG
jgi:glucose/arabinose dehydrogenase